MALQEKYWPLLFLCLLIATYQDDCNCQLESAQCILQVQLSVPPQVIPVFLHPPQDMVVETGQELAITCAAQGDPQPTVIWVKERDGYDEYIFHNEGGEALAQVSQRGGRCPMPGDIQGHDGQGSEEPDLVENVPAHCRELDYMTFEGPFQPKLFYDPEVLGVTSWFGSSGPFAFRSFAPLFYCIHQSVRRKRVHTEYPGGS